jgi:hypothetical protein
MSKTGKERSIGLTEVFVVIVLVIVVGFAAWRSLVGTQLYQDWVVPIVESLRPKTDQPVGDASKEVATEDVDWQFDGQKWQAVGKPPICPDPLTFKKSPVKVSLASSILYPGQYRGGDYKPHGGFRFDNKKNEDVQVVAPMDARLVSGSRYIEAGEVQYLLFFVNNCGIAYRFDHLLTLSPRMQKLAEALPQPKAGDSRTTRLTPVEVKAGEVIATAVGFKNSGNVSLDFGVYDLRKPNEASQVPDFAKAHAKEMEQAFYGLCWFDLLPAADAKAVKALPGSGSGFGGDISDYCK